MRTFAAGGHSLSIGTCLDPASDYRCKWDGTGISGDMLSFAGMLMEMLEMGLGGGCMTFSGEVERLERK